MASSKSFAVSPSIVKIVQPVKSLRFFKSLLLMCAVVFLACSRTSSGNSMRVPNLRKIEFNSTFGSLEYPRISVIFPMGGWCFSG